MSSNSQPSMLEKTKDTLLGRSDPTDPRSHKEYQDNAAKAAGDATRRAGDAANHIGENISNKATELKNSAYEKAQNASQKVSDYFDTTSSNRNTRDTGHLTETGAKLSARAQEFKEHAAPAHNDNSLFGKSSSGQGFSSQGEYGDKGVLERAKEGVQAAASYVGDSLTQAKDAVFGTDRTDANAHKTWGDNSAKAAGDATRRAGDSLNYAGQNISDKASEWKDKAYNKSEEAKQNISDRFDNSRQTGHFTETGAKLDARGQEFSDHAQGKGIIEQAKEGVSYVGNVASNAASNVKAGVGNTASYVANAASNTANSAAEALGLKSREPGIGEEPSVSTTHISAGTQPGYTSTTTTTKVVQPDSANANLREL